MCSSAKERGSKHLFTGQAPIVWRLPGLSGLTKKSVYADKLLAKILGVDEGAHVSYADLSRGLHKYIKDNNLKSLHLANSAVASEHNARPEPATDTATLVTVSMMKKCRDCAEEIPVEAAFCDLCGVRQ
jgi:hypothetical protein